VSQKPRRKRGRGGKGRRRANTAAAAPASAAAPVGPVTYVSAWVTRNGPSVAANSRQPHRLYAFTNSTGHTVYISNQNIRNPLSGLMGRHPPPTNNEYRALLEKLIRKKGGHPRYISNMTRNIIAARVLARSGVLRARGRRPPTNQQKENNRMHDKQIEFWRQIQRIVNAIPNGATHRTGNVSANVRTFLESSRDTIKHS
jgi:hypothetical protein